MSKFT